MNYQRELHFVEKLMQNYRISYNYIRVTMEQIPDVDFGLRRLLYPDIDYSEIAREFLRWYAPGIIYKIQDYFSCNYILFQMPDLEEVTYMVIGPYMINSFSPELLLKKFPDSPASILPQLENFYTDLPIIPEESRIMTILYSLGEYMWGGIDNFSVKNVQNFVFDKFEPVAQRPQDRPAEEPYLSMKLLEDRYAIEDQLMQAVAQGQTHKAEMHINALIARQEEQRTTDSLRNSKNYTVILNTLLRKAAEIGAVHPLHIDSLSSRYARKIEHCLSTSSLESLRREMVHKYCLLVKNHSMKGYSLLVRKVLTQIDSDLTADLSLRAQAELLNINPSYLSTLFRKETGYTLTEYVNKKRIEHAIFLLNTTNQQIQMIAQSCGIPDVNYFTKTFKKYIGMTPKDYRDNIVVYKHDTTR